MRLYLVRHAIAVPRGTAGFLNDADRPLTPEGRTQARKVARGLKRLGITVDVILTSPLVRSQETAQQISKEFGAEAALRKSEALLPDASPRETMKAMQTYTRKEGLMAVGHEPHMTRWLTELIAGESGFFRCVLKKGAVVCVEMEGKDFFQGAGTLRWMLTPKQLSLIGKA